MFRVFGLVCLSLVLSFVRPNVVYFFTASFWFNVCIPLVTPSLVSLGFSVFCVTFFLSLVVSFVVSFVRYFFMSFSLPPVLSFFQYLFLLYLVMSLFR